MKKKIITILIILYFCTNATLFLFSDEYDDLFNDISTEEEATDEAAETDSSFDFDTPKFKLSILGDHSFEFHVPITKDHLDFYGEIKAPRFSNDLGLELSYKMLSVVTHWRLDLKLNDFGSVEDVLIVRPEENYIKINPWKFSIAAGFQEFSWGTADGLNPTDNLNPRDYRFGLDADKLSVLSAYIGFFPLNFMSIEAVYIPFEQPDLFPIDFADNIPDEIFYGLTPTFSPEEFPKDAGITNLKFDPTSFVLGGKLSFYFRYADFSFSYIYDVDPYFTPLIYINLDNIIPSVLNTYKVKEIDLVKRRLHRFGADFKTNIDRFGLWLEICYTMSEDYLMNLDNIRNHTFGWTLGFDFNYGPNDDFYFNLQYMGQFNPLFDTEFYNDYEDGRPDSDKIDDKDYMEEYYNRMLVNSLGGIREGLLQGLSMKMEWPVMNSLLTPSITVAYFIPLIYDYDEDIRYGSLALNPELDIMPIDSLHISIGASLSYAWHKKADENIDIDYMDNLGTFFNENNIYIEIKYKWNYDFEK